MTEPLHAADASWVWGSICKRLFYRCILAVECSAGERSADFEVVEVGRNWRVAARHEEWKSRPDGGDPGELHPFELHPFGSAMAAYRNRSQVSLAFSTRNGVSLQLAWMLLRLFLKLISPRHPQRCWR